jgi:hypothetical protein
MNILSILDNKFNSLNNSKYFIGLMMILLNVGSKYLFDEFGELHNLLLTKKIIRRLMIFVIVFIAIRDIKISIIITFLFIIIVLELCNEKSKYCIIPNTLNKIDTNNDGKIDGDEIKNAFNLLIKTGHI